MAFNGPEFFARCNFRVPYNSFYFYSMWILKYDVPFEYLKFSILELRGKKCIMRSWKPDDALEMPMNLTSKQSKRQKP